MKDTDGRGRQVGNAPAYRTVWTRGGMRLVQHGVVLSEVRSTPGSRHSVADAIAAVVCAVGGGRRVAMLGFAGGGLMAPLRAMARGHRVEAVDLDGSGYQLFRRLCRAWAGNIRYEQAHASEWLRFRRGRFDAIIDDLSIAEGSEVVNPAETWSELPSLMYRRLSREGVAVFNLLHPGHASWAAGYNRVLRTGFVARAIHFADYENRLLVVARWLAAARELSLEIGMRLRGIGSRLASGISVRTAPGLR